MECGGHRVSELSPPHSARSAGVGRLDHGILLDTCRSRHLVCLLAAQRPSNHILYCPHCLLFCLLFFDQFLEGTFSIFCDFRRPRGTQQIIKNREKSVSNGVFFSTSVFSLIFDEFGMFFVAFGRCGFHWQGRCNMHFRQNRFFSLPGAIFAQFFLILERPWEPKMQKNHSREGV